MRVTGIGSTYLWAMVDADKNYLDGAKTYKVTLPKDIPQANFWSITLYDNQSRSMLDTPQRYPRAPEQPEGVGRGNWTQTMPGKSYFSMLRLYSPLEPFFAKTWRPSEVEPVQ